jgi:uncharacterized membrane protein YbjE (DUF340 family)
MMKEIFLNLWLILSGLNFGLFTFSIVFQQYDLAALNMLSAIAFLVGYSIKKNEDTSSKE